MTYGELARDPRHYQISILTGLVAFAVFALGIPISLPALATAILSTLGTQWLCTRLWKLPSFDPRSALISGLSLTLLLRADSLGLIALAGAIAMASKFVFRRGGKHIFNPTNFGIVLLLLLTDRAWVSPGQWGSFALFAFALAGLGGLVVYRSARSDVTYAFLGTYATLLVLRAVWLGDPWTIPFHQLQNGGFLLFAFYMISDPKTTPNSRSGRILYAICVAVGAAWVHFGLFQTNGFLWSLIALAPFVPLIDRILPGELYEWTRSPASLRVSTRKAASMNLSRLQQIGWSACLSVTLLNQPASAFCGFYVAQADAELFNDASQVVLVRDGDRTVVTMASDYIGELKEFALVVPVPTVLQEGQVHVTNQAILDHLDAYTAPRLVEYFDPEPCQPHSTWGEIKSLSWGVNDSAEEPMAESERRRKDSRVTIEATYTVGEYDILVLSAKESDGLRSWLEENGYRVPQKAEQVLGSYIKQGMKFFVAKVNLEEQSKLGLQNLRPIQMAFETDKFALPIRLGTVNSRGTQEMIVYTLTRTGRVETTNYRAIKIPSDVDIPEYIQDDFGGFYSAMFDREYDKANGRGVFLEYAWDMNWCDPCAADPLSDSELSELGVFWEQENRVEGRSRKSGTRDVFVTRLHVRYDGAHFPEDLVFQETGDRSNFQGRYVVHHAWAGDISCSEDEEREYYDGLRKRQIEEAQVLASLTGWELADIHRDMDHSGATDGNLWWKALWEN